MRTSMGISMGSDSFVSAQMHDGSTARTKDYDCFTVVRHSAELALSSSSAPTLGHFAPDRFLRAASCSVTSSTGSVIPFR